MSFLAQNYHRPRLSEVISVFTMITLITIINHHHEMSIKAPVSMRLALPQRPPVRQYTHVCHPTICVVTLYESYKYIILWKNKYDAM